MSEAQITKVVQAVLDAQSGRAARSSTNMKILSTVLGVLVAVGTVYSVYFQPATVAAAAEETEKIVDAHVRSIHTRMESRLDRIETKLDRAIERKQGG